MEKELYIHVGKHKTGTTAIQSFMALNRKELKRHGVLYPGKADNHFLIADELRSNEHPFFNPKSQTVKIFNEIRKNFDKYDKFVLSTEAFCENDNLIIPRLVTTIKHFNLNININIIIFYRLQHEWFESVYQQLVRAIDVRYTKTFTEFVEHKLKFNDGNYFSLLNRWAKGFGKNNIISMPYNSKQERNKIYTDFTSLLGISSDLSLKIPPKSKLNISLTHENIEFLRWLNLFSVRDETFEEVLNIFSHAPKAKQDKRTFLDPELRSTILAHYESSNKLVAKEYLNRGNCILFEYSEELNNEKGNYKQHDLYRAGLFTQQFELLQNNNSKLVIQKISNQLVKLRPSSRKIYESKNSFLSTLNSYISAESLEKVAGLSDREIENITIADEFEEMELAYKITHTNFYQYLFNQSIDISSPIISADNSIQIISTGNDPYFSIRKHLGNYENSTILRISLDVTQETSIQLFYQTRKTQNYIKENSIVKAIQEGSNELYFKIDDPLFNGQIRIDPGNYIGKYQIYEIELRSSAKSYDVLFYEYQMLKSRLISD